LYAASFEIIKGKIIDVSLLYAAGFYSEILQRAFAIVLIKYKLTSEYQRYILNNNNKKEERKRMHRWWSFCILYLLICLVRVILGDSGLSCCVCVMSFEC